VTGKNRKTLAENAEMQRKERKEERRVSGGGEKNLAGSRRTTTVSATRNHPENTPNPDGPDKTNPRHRESSRTHPVPSAKARWRCTVILPRAWWWRCSDAGSDIATWHVGDWQYGDIAPPPVMQKKNWRLPMRPVCQWTAQSRLENRQCCIVSCGCALGKPTFKLG
jgi:hypothetical protein